jgi:hypothetical protein
VLSLLPDAKYLLSGDIDMEFTASLCPTKSGYFSYFMFSKLAPEKFDLLNSESLIRQFYILALEKSHLDMSHLYK